MKIVNNMASAVVRFKNLGYGDCFIAHSDDEDVRMKILDVHADDDDYEHIYNCVNLSNGNIEIWREEEKVIFIMPRLVID